MKAVILGCGTSGGVPRIGADWGACDPAEPRNRRRRCSILVQDAGSTVLVDTSPDLRMQLLDARVDRVDGVIWTHEHADQAHGIDDLRPLALRQRAPLDGWLDARTFGILGQRFDYIFQAPPGSFYPAIVRHHLFEFGIPFRVGRIDVLPILQDHGGGPSAGFRFGPIGYSNDVVALDETAFAALEGVKIWIVDAMRYRPHPTHAHLDLTLEWIERVRPERTILTNMHVDMDYRTLCKELPAGVEPGYDGMVLEA